MRDRPSVESLEQNTSMRRSYWEKVHLLCNRSCRGIVLTCLLLLSLEGVLRFGAFLWFHHSQYYLLYGFHTMAGKVGINAWQTSTGEYYKFPPNYIVRGAAGQASETASINSLGFRGPEFQASKPEGVFRIICM